MPFHDGRRALKAIVATVPPEMGAPLTDNVSAKEAWDSIAAARIGVDRVRRATCSGFAETGKTSPFTPGEQIEDFAIRLSTLKQQMAHHGDEDLTEEHAVEKLLRAMPKKYT